MEDPNLHFDIRNCLECGKELKGRAGKKYCDVACKSAYHNRHQGFGQITINQTNRIIRHNRSILKTLSPEGKATVRKEVLDQMGYDYRYFAGVFKTGKSIYYLVYDYGFTPLYEGVKQKALIVPKQNYMNKPGFEVWKA